jgi:hypothetical protein
LSSSAFEQFEFRSGHARHDFVLPGPALLRVHTAWACPDRSHSLQLEPVESSGAPGVVELRLVLVPESDGFAPAEPNVRTAECTLPTESEVRQVVLHPGGTSLPVTRSSGSGARRPGRR